MILHAAAGEEPSIALENATLSNNNWIQPMEDEMRSGEGEGVTDLNTPRVLI